MPHKFCLEKRCRVAFHTWLDENGEAPPLCRQCDAKRRNMARLNQKLDAHFMIDRSPAGREDR